MASGPEGASPQLSVVLSTLGNYEVLGRVLDGYSRQDCPPGTFEVIVVVDLADPEPGRIEELVAALPYPARQVTGRMRGLSANRNTGWREARAPVVLLTDNDTIPVPRLVSEHVEWHRRNPEVEVAVVGHVRWAPELRATAFMRWLERGIQFDYPSIKGTEAAWAHLYGANSSIKRSFIERVGDWDEVRLPYGYEDIDWGYRAREHGLRVLYNRRAVVDHLRRDDDLEHWKGRMRRIALTEHRFTEIHPELPPWFFNMFSGAVSLPPARGRGARLASFVPPWVPWLGPRVWGAATVYWQQQLAPYFLEAWEEASSAGSSPGGPK